MINDNVGGSAGTTVQVYPVTSLNSRKPSSSYYYSAAAAILGLVTTAIAVEGTRRVGSGQLGISALDSAGLTALIFGWALAYFMRLSFASFVTPVRQAQVTLAVRIVFALELAAALLGSIYVFGFARAGGFWPLMLIADLLQVGTVLWIVRYSRE